MILQQHTYTVIGHIIQAETPNQIVMKVHSILGDGGAAIPGGQIRLLLFDEASRFYARQAVESLALGQKSTLLYQAIVSDLPDHPTDILFAFLSTYLNESEVSGKPISQTQQSTRQSQLYEHG